MEHGDSLKNWVVGCRLALYVNDVYAAPRGHNGLQLTIATFFFAYQIYCDFSGDWILLLARPRFLASGHGRTSWTSYYSLSISEFWHRWHISLSTWFKDYLYIPLGGSRVNKSRHIANLLITFGISGRGRRKLDLRMVGIAERILFSYGVAHQRLGDRLFGRAQDCTNVSFIRKAIMLLSTFILTRFAVDHIQGA